MPLPVVPILLVGAALMFAGRRRRSEPQWTRPESWPAEDYTPQDECDPLDPSTWGEGWLCVDWEGRWITVPAAAPPPASTQQASGWPCPRLYNGYCIEIWDRMEGVGPMAMAPPHAWAWRISTQEGQVVDESKSWNPWGDFRNRWSALNGAYAYIDTM